MEEETKNRLRKFGKVTAYALGLFAMLFLGVGLGNCSARKAVGSNAYDDSLINEDYVAQNDLLRGARWYEGLSYTFDGDEANLIHGSWGTLEISLPRAGLYAFVDDTEITARPNLQFYNTQSHNWLVNPPSAGSLTNSVKSVFWGLSKHINVFNVTDSDISAYSYLGVACVPSVKAHLFLLENDDFWLNANYLNDITFPADYNPFSGFGFSSAGLLGQLAGSQSSPFKLNMVFRSGGHVFKRIEFYFLPAQGMRYLPDGATSPVTFTGSGYHYPSLINFVDYNDVSFMAWRAVFGVDSDGNPYLTNYGEWTSDQYRRIEVLDYVPVTGISGLAPNLDQVGILELRTAGGVPTPVIGGNGNADVFSLLSTGFSSVASILSIQILPYLTLGTLLFVPLVVLIIFSILKVLNK